jgi:hypothetical protein
LGVQLALYRLRILLTFLTLFSNDVHAILVTYGVEAARQAIVKEIKGEAIGYGVIFC